MGNWFNTDSDDEAQDEASERKMTYLRRLLQITKAYEKQIVVLKETHRLEIDEIQRKADQTLERKLRYGIICCECVIFLL